MNRQIDLCSKNDNQASWHWIYANDWEVGVQAVTQATAMRIASRPGWSIRISLVVLLVVLAHAAVAAEIIGRVVGITDGDTLTVLSDLRQQTKVRLAEIDTPESGQPYGSRARQALSDLAGDAPRSWRTRTNESDRIV